MNRTKRISCFLLTVSAFCVAGAAGAEDTISVQGGLFSPWDGGNGASAALQYAHKIGDRHYVGAEFEYRNFDGEVFGIETELDTFHLRAIYRVDLLVDSVITPYLGVGLGVAVNSFDSNDIERELMIKNPGTFVDAPSIGAGIGVLGIVGLDARMPSVSWVSIFGEARFGYNAQFSTIDTVTNNGVEDDGDVEVDNLGGISVHGGVRFHF